MKQFAMFALAAVLAGASPAKADPAAQEYAKHANDFGMKVFQHLYKNGKAGENILYSPISMHYALSMVGHFADTDTQKSMYTAFWPASAHCRPVRRKLAAPALFLQRLRDEPIQS